MTGQQQSKVRRLNRHWQSGGSVGKEQLIIYDSQYYEPVVGQFYPKDYFYRSGHGFYNTARLTARGYKSDSPCFPQVKIAQDGLYELKYNLTFALVDPLPTDKPDYIEVTDVADIDANSGIINIMLEMPQQEDERANHYRPVRSPLTFQYAKEHGFSTVYIGAHYNYVAGDGNISGAVPEEYRKYCITDWNTNEFIPGENRFVSPYFNFNVALVGQFKYFSHHEQNLNQRFLLNIKKPPYKYLLYDIVLGGYNLTLERSKWTCPKITMWLNADKFPSFSSWLSIAYFGKVWLERVGDYTQDQEWNPHL